jgi:hypothetical protein
MLYASIPVYHCASCDFSFTTDESSNIKQNMVNKHLNKTKKIGRPKGSKKTDNVQLNIRYPRALDDLVRADGEPSKVIVPILMRHYGVEV